MAVPEYSRTADHPGCTLAARTLNLVLVSTPGRNMYLRESTCGSEKVGLLGGKMNTKFSTGAPAIFALLRNREFLVLIFRWRARPPFMNDEMGYFYCDFGIPLWARKICLYYPQPADGIKRRVSLYNTQETKLTCVLGGRACENCSCPYKIPQITNHNSCFILFLN